MAKKGKATTKKPASTPSIAQPIEQSNVPATTTSEPLAKRSIRQIALRFVNSGIDFLLDNFWWGVVFVMTSTTAVIWLYIQSGRAAWLYPYLYFALGFLTAGLTLIAMYSLLFYVQAKRRKALERAKNLKFVSQEKGFIDFIVDKQKSEEQLSKVLTPIVNEITGLGKTATRFHTSLSPTMPFVKRQKLATRAARTFDRHSSKLERQLETFEKLNSVIYESNVGFIGWLTPTDPEHEQALINSHQVFSGLLDGLRFALPSIEALNNTASEQRGISQDLNTALNRLTHVLSGLITEMRKSEQHWEHLIRIIEIKLST